MLHNPSAAVMVMAALPLAVQESQPHYSNLALTTEVLAKPLSCWGKQEAERSGVAREPALAGGSVLVCSAVRVVPVFVPVVVRV
jgi:hypothetical protein